MLNHEVIPVTLPSSSADAAQVEKWLENIARRGGELVAFAPTTDPNKVVAIFRDIAAPPANHEAVVAQVPAGRKHAEFLEGWLEDLSGRGGTLLTFMPTSDPNRVLGIFRVTTRGQLR